MKSALRVLLFFYFFILSFFHYFTLHAQQSRILPCDAEWGKILTLRTEVDGRLEPLPMLYLPTAGSPGGSVVEVSFDEMSHEYHRYVYRLEHCNLRWEPTEDLFYSEYAESTADEVPIEEYTESRNVTTHYTHYSFTFPNEDMRPLVSGNYRLTILCDEGEEPVPVAEVCLRVVEPLVGVTADVTTNTEIDVNDRHQQLTMSIDCSHVQSRDLRDEIHTVVLQNDRLDNAVVDAPPSYVNGSHLTWDHQRDLVFPAGNEYRKYEILSARYPGLHTESIHYFEPYLHATLMADEQRRNYLVAEDLNGINVIRNTDNQDDATETEYMLTHFSLLCKAPLDDADVFLNGKWTTGGVCPEWKMQYDEQAQAYIGTFMLKQGYYNYQYLVVPREEQFRRSPFHQPKGLTAPFEGDYYQTSNEYRIMVYLRQPGARYDRLVGCALVKS